MQPNEAAVVFQALGNDLRLKILMKVAKSAISVGEIADACSTPQPTISHHLALLKAANLVMAQRHGKSIHYIANMERLKYACLFFDQLI